MASENKRIPLRQLWGIRYRAYRHKYGRLKAFLKGIVLGEIAMRLPKLGAHGIIQQDELDLLQHLVRVELSSVEFYFPSQENPQYVESDDGLAAF